MNKIVGLVFLMVSYVYSQTTFNLVDAMVYA